MALDLGRSSVLAALVPDTMLRSTQEAAQQNQSRGSAKIFEGEILPSDQRLGIVRQNNFLGQIETLSPVRDFLAGIGSFRAERGPTDKASNIMAPTNHRSQR